jgi:type I restriction enzyme S subunit
MKDSGIRWLGKIPANWTVTTLKRTARDGYRTFIDGDWIEAPYVTDEGIRLLQTGNIGTGYFKEQGFRYVSEDTFRELRCTEVLPRDVLVCRLDGPVGRACLAPDLGCRMITSVDVTIIKTDASHDPRFLVYLLSLRPYLDWVGSLCRVGGGHRFRISRTMLGDFLMPLPPRDEQSKLADHLDTEIGRGLSLERSIEQQIDKLREYRQTLISAAVTGKIDVMRSVH